LLGQGLTTEKIWLDWSGSQANPSPVEKKRLNPSRGSTQTMAVKIVIMLSLLAVWISGCTQPGYRDMIHDFESYQPPPYIRAMAEERAPSAPSPEDNAFRAEKERIEAAATRLKQSLTQRDPKTAFFSPDPELMASLEPAKRHKRSNKRSYSIDLNELICNCLLREFSINRFLIRAQFSND
jgi:hypothetical protein